MSRSKGSRLNLVLALVLIGLCAAYWGVLRMQDRRAEQAESAKRLFDFAAEDVVSLELHHIDEAPISAVRGADGEWSIDEPSTKIVASQAVWDRVAKAVAELSRERLLENAKPDAPQYGLEAPRLQVLAGTQSGEVVQIVLGDDDPTKQYAYAQVNGPDVMLISNRSFFELNRRLDQLRETLIFAIGDEGISRIEYARIWRGGAEEGEESEAREVGSESELVILDRGPDNRWRIIEPRHGLADQEMVNALASELQFMRGRQHVDQPESLHDYGLNPPSARISVHTKGSDDKQTLFLGWLDGDTETGGVFVKRANAPAVSVVDSHLIALLPRSPNGFRDRRLVTRDLTPLERIEITRRDGPDIVLVNDVERGWDLEAPDYPDTNQSAVSNFVASLKELEGLGFRKETGPEAGFDAPEAALRLYFRDGERPYSVVVGKAVPDPENTELVGVPANVKADDQVFVRQETGDTLAVSGGMVERLRVTPFDFRRRELWRPGEGEVSRIALEYEGTEYIFERPGEKWLLQAPADKRLDSESDVEAIIEGVARLRITDIAIDAGRFQALGPERESEFARMGLDEPKLAVSFDIRGQDGETETFGPLTVGGFDPENARDRYAVLAGREEVLVVPQDFVDDVREALSGLVGE